MAKAAGVWLCGAIAGTIGPEGAHATPLPTALEEVEKRSLESVVASFESIPNGEDRECWSRRYCRTTLTSSGLV